jgi:hypothetical protein
VGRGIIINKFFWQIVLSAHIRPQMKPNKDKLGVSSPTGGTPTNSPIKMTLAMDHRLLISLINFSF